MLRRRRFRLPSSRSPANRLAPTTGKNGSRQRRLPQETFPAPDIRSVPPHRCSPPSTFEIIFVVRDLSPLLHPPLTPPFTSSAHFQLIWRACDPPSASAILPGPLADNKCEFSPRIGIFSPLAATCFAVFNNHSLTYYAPNLSNFIADSSGINLSPSAPISNTSQRHWVRTRGPNWILSLLAAAFSQFLTLFHSHISPQTSLIS